MKKIFTLSVCISSSIFAADFDPPSDDEFEVECPKDYTIQSAAYGYNGVRDLFVTVYGAPGADLCMQYFLSPVSANAALQAKRKETTDDDKLKALDLLLEVFPPAL